MSRHYGTYATSLHPFGYDPNAQSKYFHSTVFREPEHGSLRTRAHLSWRTGEHLSGEPENISMFSTCSELTPRAPIPDDRMERIMHIVKHEFSFLLGGQHGIPERDADMLWLDQHTPCLHTSRTLQLRLLLLHGVTCLYFLVVTLATYAYFVACLFGRQYLLPTQYKVEGDTYVAVRFPLWMENAPVIISLLLFF